MHVLQLHAEQGKKLTQWEIYLCERRRKKKEKRLERKSKPSPVDENGFNDEFFQPEVTMATAKVHQLML